MRKEDCIDMFKRIPAAMHAQVNLVLRNSFMLSIESVVRYEETYIVFRGREGGTTDEGRAFFVPYEEVSHLKIERAVRLGELKMMFGESGYVDAEDRLSNASAAADAADAAKNAASIETPPPTPGPMEPGSIAKQNLLDRIRAARANVAGATGRLGSGGNK